MEIKATYEGYNNDFGMEFAKKSGAVIYIRDGEMALTVGKEHKIIAHEYDLGNYGDDLIVTDYEIEETVVHPATKINGE